MDEWYLFNILNIELSGAGVSSDVIWKKRQTILALCHLFINIINFVLFEKLFQVHRMVWKKLWKPIPSNETKGKLNEKQELNTQKGEKNQVKDGAKGKYIPRGDIKFDGKQLQGFFLF